MPVQERTRRNLQVTITLVITSSHSPANIFHCISPCWRCRCCGSAIGLLVAQHQLDDRLVPTTANATAIMLVLPTTNNQQLRRPWQDPKTAKGSEEYFFSHISKQKLKSQFFFQLGLAVRLVNRITVRPSLITYSAKVPFRMLPA